MARQRDLFGGEEEGSFAKKFNDSLSALLDENKRLGAFVQASDAYWAACTKSDPGALSTAAGKFYEARKAVGGPGWETAGPELVVSAGEEPEA